MAHKQAEPRIIFGNTLKDEVSFNSNVETKVDDVVAKKLKAIGAWVITILLSVVFGGIITSLWDMNGKISTVVGQESIRSEMTDVYKMRIELLSAEKKGLENKIDDLKNEISKLKEVSK